MALSRAAWWPCAALVVACQGQDGSSSSSTSGWPGPGSSSAAGASSGVSSSSSWSSMASSGTSNPTPTAACGDADGGSYTDGGAPRTTAEFSLLTKCDAGAEGAITSPSPGNGHRFLWSCTAGSLVTSCSRRVGYTVSTAVTGGGTASIATRLPPGSAGVVGGGGSFTLDVVPNAGSTLGAVSGTAPCGTKDSNTSFTGVTGDCAVTVGFLAANQTPDPALASTTYGTYGAGLWAPPQAMLPANIDGTTNTAITYLDWIVADGGVGDQLYLPGCLNNGVGSVFGVDTCAQSFSYSGVLTYLGNQPIHFSMPMKVLSIRYWARDPSHYVAHPSQQRRIDVGQTAGGAIPSLLVWLTDSDNPTRSYAATPQACRGYNGGQTIFTGGVLGAGCQLTPGKLYYLNMFLNSPTARLVTVTESNSDFVL